MLVPILISMSVPVLTAVGLSQAIQLPVAIAATFGNALYGQVDLAFGGILAASLTVGSWCGAKLAHVVPRATLSPDRVGRAGYGRRIHSGQCGLAAVAVTGSDGA